MTSVEQPAATFRPSALLGGSLSPSAGHLPFASDLLAAVKPSVVVELGVGFGDTYFGFCQLITEHGLSCSVYGIDTWVSSSSATFEMVSRYNTDHYKTFSHLVRKSFDDAWTQFADDSIGLLNLDGQQPHDMLKHIFDSWLAKVQPGGLVLIHNISLRGEDGGAARLWNEIKSRFPHFSFRHNNGLGILAKSPRNAKQIPYLDGMFNANGEEQDLFRRRYSLFAERLDQPVKTPAAHTPNPFLFQVFHSYSQRYETTPELSLSAKPGAWVNLSLNLPQGLGSRPLRLDLARQLAVVDIATLSLRKEDGHAAWTWNPKDAAEQLRLEGKALRLPEPEFFRILALGESARVFLPELEGDAFQEPLELEIRLRVDLELSALQALNQKWPESGKVGDVDASLAKAKADSAKFLAQSRIEYDAKIKQINTEADARVDAMRSELEAVRAEMESDRADLQHNLALQMAQAAEERRNHQVITLEKENLAAQQPGLLQEISIAQGNVEELKAEVERLSGELANFEFDLTEVRKLNARLGATLEEERSTRADMQESGSWQLTKPLRAVGDLFGPRKKY